MGTPFECRYVKSGVLTTAFPCKYVAFKRQPQNDLCSTRPFQSFSGVSEKISPKWNTRNETKKKKKSWNKCFIGKSRILRVRFAFLHAPPEFCKWNRPSIINRRDIKTSAGWLDCQNQNHNWWYSMIINWRKREKCKLLYDVTYDFIVWWKEREKLRGKKGNSKKIEDRFGQWNVLTFHFKKVAYSVEIVQLRKRG